MAASSLAFALLLVGLVMLVPVWIIVFRWVSVKCGLGKGSVWRPVDVTQLQPQWKTRLHTASLTEFHQRPPGFTLDMIQAALSTISCGLFVLATYLPEEQQLEPPLWLALTELVITTYFAFDYALQLFLAQDALRLFFSFSSFIDLVTVVPVWIDVIAEQYMGGLGEASSNITFTLRMFRVFRAVRIVRVVRLAPSFALHKQIFLLAVSVFSLVFVAAGIFHALEDDGAQFHSVLYYMTVTVIGRPRVPAESGLAQLLLIATVVVAAISIPTMLAPLVKLWIQAGLKKPYKLVRGARPHVIVTGHVHPQRISGFLGQFFHEGRSLDLVPPVCIFAEQKLVGKFRSIIDDHKFGELVQYVRGTPSSPYDLALTRVDVAATLLILASNRASEADDVATVAACLSAKAANPGIRIFAQVAQSSSRDRMLGLPGWQAGFDQCVCTHRFAGAIVGTSCVVPGFGTLLCNLMQNSSRDEATKPIVGADAEARRRVQAEYHEGFSQRLISVQVPSFMDGVASRIAAEFIFKHCGAVLLAVHQRREDALLEPPTVQLFTPTAKLRTHSVMLLIGSPQDYQEALDNVQPLWSEFCKRRTRTVAPRLTANAQPKHPTHARRHVVPASARAASPTHVTIDPLVMPRSANTHPSPGSGGGAESGPMSDHILLCGSSYSLRQLAHAVRGQLYVPLQYSESQDSLFEAVMSGVGWQSRDALPSRWKIVVLAPRGDRPRKVPKGVTWIDGDPQSVDDLLRAGVTTARAAIVSSPILSKTKAGVEQGDLMDDINALSISCTIYKLNPTLHVVTELLHASHGAYVRPVGTTLDDAAAHAHMVGRYNAQLQDAGSFRLMGQVKTYEPIGKAHHDWFSDTDSDDDASVFTPRRAPQPTPRHTPRPPFTPASHGHGAFQHPIAERDAKSAHSGHHSNFGTVARAVNRFKKGRRRFVLPQQSDVLTSLLAAKKAEALNPSAPKPTSAPSTNAPSSSLAALHSLQQSVSAIQRSHRDALRASHARPTFTRLSIASHPTPFQLYGSPAMACGRAFALSTIDSIVCESEFRPLLLPTIMAVLRACRSLRLHLLPVVSLFRNSHWTCAHLAEGAGATGSVQDTPCLRHGHTYGEVVSAVLSHWGAVPLGLYRRTFCGSDASNAPHLAAASVHTHHGDDFHHGGVFTHRDDLLSYVFTNPRPTTRLNTNDLLYVLAPPGL